MNPAAIILSVTYGLSALAEMGVSMNQFMTEVENSPELPDEVRQRVIAHVKAAGDRWRNAPGPVDVANQPD